MLLRRLLSDPALEGVTHVVVDEVHERSADSDQLLLLLRDLLGCGAKPKLRVVLMSATAEAGLFQRYFDSAFAMVSPVLSILYPLPLSSVLNRLTGSFKALGRMVLGDSTKTAACAGAWKLRHVCSGDHSRLHSPSPGVLS